MKFSRRQDIIVAMAMRLSQQQKIKTYKSEIFIGVYINRALHGRLEIRNFSF